MTSRVYEVVFKKSAVKELRELPDRIRSKVLEAVQFLSLNPYSDLLQVKKMKGVEGLYRVRVQDYRIIYSIDGQRIRIASLRSVIARTSTTEA